MAQIQQRETSRPPNRARLILPFVACGLLIAGVGLMIARGERQQTVSEVARTIRQVALRGGAPNGNPEAGSFGPWLLAAGSVDPVTGLYHDFTITSGDLLIGAARAKLHVDPDSDTFTFEMWNVVYTVAPDAANAETESYVYRKDHYLLGPAPYGVDIVPDGDSGGIMPTPSATPPTEGIAGAQRSDDRP
jgi:hypothetical protein